MQVYKMTLLAALILVVVCIISTRRNHPRSASDLRPVDIASLFETSRRSNRMGHAGYLMRTLIQDSQGQNRFVRFSIVKRFGRYRAYLEDGLSFSNSYEALGFKRDTNGRYYLDSRTTSAAGCEAHVRNWAESRSDQIEYIEP